MHKEGNEKVDPTRIERMKSFRFKFRLVGSVGSLGGAIVVLGLASLLFDPESTIGYGGVTTTDFSAKLKGVVISSVIEAGLLFCLIVPEKYLDKLFDLIESISALQPRI